MRDLSLLIKNLTHTPCIGRPHLNHWTAKRSSPGAFYKCKLSDRKLALLCQDLNFDEIPLWSVCIWYTLPRGSTCSPRRRNVPFSFLSHFWFLVSRIRLTCPNIVSRHSTRLLPSQLGVFCVCLWLTRSTPPSLCGAPVITSKYPKTGCCLVWPKTGCCLCLTDKIILSNNCVLGPD